MERIAPDGIVELVFHYLEPMEVRLADEAFAVQPRTSLVCQTHRYVEIRPQGAVGLISVRFRPWGAYHFLGPPVSVLSDQIVFAEDVWPRSVVTEIEESLAVASSAARRVALVEQFLLERLRDNQKADVEALVRSVWRRKGKIRITELCNELGVGERSLQRVFSRAFGTTPKHFARLTRFLTACGVLRQGGWESLTAVGHDCGYYDQAHFIQDFKALSGLTPGEMLSTSSFSFLEID